MKAIITGMNGTVAPAIARTLHDADWQCVTWDRTHVPIDDETAMRRFLQEEQPDWLLHIATGPPEWAESLARFTHELRIKLMFTSSVSVFAGRLPGDSRGPYQPADVPDSEEDYGRYKADCERRVREANPNALIVRLGWQIGEAAGSNNMLDFLVRTARENHGRIEASSRWFPSCSFLSDTVEAIKTVLEHPDRFPAGTYNLNGNPQFTFLEIVQGLRKLHAADWQVNEVTDFARDDRMTDDRVRVRSIGERLN